MSKYNHTGHVRRDGLTPMDRVAGLEDLLVTPATPLWQLLDGSQPCNATDPHTPEGRKRRDTFHPEKGNQSAIPGKDCSGCPFRIPCAHYAVRHERLGWWGNLSAKDREIIRSKLGISLEAPSLDFMPHGELVAQRRREEAAARRLLRKPVKDAHGKFVGWTEVAA